MESLFYNISQVLGITLIHSLWQGLLVWFALRIILSCAPSLPSVKKHDLAMLSLITVSALFIYTFITQLREHTWVYFIGGDNITFIPQMLRPLLHHDITNARTSSYYTYIIEGYLPYLSALYFAGLTFNLLKLGLSWQRLSLIKRTMIPADQLQQFTDELCKKLGISKTVWVNFSRLTDVPCMIGYFSPIILLPITLTTYLSTKEVETILLHELSHIKRNDYLLNLLQQFIGILLFFNPFAQLINRIINQERENHCDDVVVETTAQPLVYAQALLKLEQTRQTKLQLALAATGKKYHLLNRIERIMKTNKPIGNIRHLLVGVAIMAASISSIAWLNPSIANGTINVKKISYHTVIKALFTDTAQKTTVKAKKAITHKTAATKATYKVNVNTNHNIDMGDITPGVDDPEMERLSADVQKHAEAIGKYFDSPEFKKQQKLIEEKAREIQDHYNSPEMMRMQESMKRMSEDFGKSFGQDGETGKMSAQMGEIGKKIGDYYNSPEFKQMNEQLEKKYGIKHTAYNNGNDIVKDENYKKYQDELKSKISPEIVQQTEQLKKMGEEMKAHYNSPEFIKKRDEMKAMGDSLRRAYSSQDMARQKADMKKISEQMRAYDNNPEIKREQEELKQATKKLHDYIKSPAFQKKVATYHKQVEDVVENKENSEDINLQSNGFGF